MTAPESIEKVLQELETYFSHANKTNTHVSAAPVSWHLAHTLKVLEAVGTNIQKTDPANYKPVWSLLKLTAMLLGRFPRGKAKAPKYVLPEKEYTIEELQNYLLSVKQLWSLVPALPANAYIKHHLFGPLNKKQAIRFGVIHTKHHLKIIREMLGNN